MLLNDDLLLNYKRCQRRAFLNVYGDFQKRGLERDFLFKLRQESKRHFDQVVSNLGLICEQPRGEGWREVAKQTEVLMSQGVDSISQGVLLCKISLFNDILLENRTLVSPKTGLLAQIAGKSEIILAGFPSLLVKKPGKSKFGNWLYEAINIKLGRRAKPEYKLVSSYHGLLLSEIQEAFSEQCYLVLRNQKQFAINLDPWLERSREIVNDCLQMLLETEVPELFISRQRCSLCPWYNACYTIAHRERHLSLVPGVTPHRYAQLKQMGFNSLESLAAADLPILEEVMGFTLAMQLKQQARSLLSNQPLLRASGQLPDPKTLPISPIELYFDIEAEPERNIDYLLGVLVVDRRENTEQFYSFIAEKPEDEGMIWQQFVNLVNSYPHAPIFHFAQYEVETIKRLAQLYHTPQIQVKSLLSRCVDLHWWVTNAVILPVESYSLKSLANWLGFTWRDPDANGEQAVCWYDQWLTTGDRSILEAILRYNEDDCFATLRLKNWLASFLGQDS